jgi:hypothetical protein
MRSTPAALALAAAVTLAGAAAGRAEDPPTKKVERIVIVHGDPGHDQAAPPDPATISGDHLKIDDLEGLAAGESRTYATESGREVSLTRHEGAGERYTIAVDGHQIEIGGLAAMAGGPGMKHVIVRRQLGDKDGKQEVEEEVTTGPMPDIAVEAGGTPPVVIEIVGEQDGKVTKRVIVLRTDEKTDKG